MPIRKTERKRYPAEWKKISDSIRFGRADSECECTGQCGSGHPANGDRCRAIHLTYVRRNRNNPAMFTIDTARALSSLYWRDQKRVVLTVAHLDHMPENNDESNLLACCQRCHFMIDNEDNIQKRKQALEKKREGKEDVKA